MYPPYSLSQVPLTLESGSKLMDGARVCSNLVELGQPTLVWAKRTKPEAAE